MSYWRRPRMEPLLRCFQCAPPVRPQASCYRGTAAAGPSSHARCRRPSPRGHRSVRQCPSPSRRSSRRARRRVRCPPSRSRSPLRCSSSCVPPGAHPLADPEESIARLVPGCWLACCAWLTATLSPAIQHTSRDAMKSLAPKRVSGGGGCGSCPYALESIFPH